METLTRWKKLISRKALLKKTIFITLVNLATFTLYGQFLQYNETRASIQLSDIIHQLVGPFDLSIPIFILFNSSIIIYFIFLFLNPRRIYVSFASYTVLMLARVTALILLPLKAPSTLIPLRDYIAEQLTNGYILKNDLFFSFHTATTFLIYYLIPEKNKSYKTFAFIMAITTAVLVILQHVHYSIDVFGGVFITYAVYKYVENINKKWLN